MPKQVGCCLCSHVHTPPTPIPVWFYCPRIEQFVRVIRTNRFAIKDEEGSINLSKHSPILSLSLSLPVVFRDELRNDFVAFTNEITEIIRRRRPHIKSTLFVLSRSPASCKSRLLSMKKNSCLVFHLRKR